MGVARNRQQPDRLVILVNAGDRDGFAGDIEFPLNHDNHTHDLSEQMILLHERARDVHSTHGKPHPGLCCPRGLKWRVWDGVVADLWEVSCAEHAEGYYVSPDPRLFIVLELDGGGAFDLRNEPSGETWQHQQPFSMSYIPAGLPVNSRVEGLRRIKHLDLHFDEAALTRRFGRGLDRDTLHETRLQFHDDTIATFAGLIAAECGSNNPTHDLYGESLVNALLAKLFSVERQGEPRRRMPLSFRKLRSLTDYIDAHCLERIRLADLASLAGLSESATSHAFKAATGMPPHRWQMHARIRKVQEMMLRDAGSLADIAEAAGFFDQAHLTRVFKSFNGLPPAAWKKEVAPTTLSQTAR